MPIAFIDKLSTAPNKINIIYPAAMSIPGIGSLTELIPGTDVL